MFASGNSAEVLSRTCNPESGSIHNYLNRQGIERRLNNEMIPLNAYTKYGRRLTTDKGRSDRRECALSRLNSAPELHKSELPPILDHSQRKMERKHRPLTPLVNSSNQTTRSLPKNYRINLDLVPLVEVGTCVGSLSMSRKRQTSLSSSDSCFSCSTPSPRLQKRLSPRHSPRLPSDFQVDSSQTAFQKRTGSTESLEEVDSDVDDDETDSKEAIILRWLQTVEKSHETSGEVLPCIKEGKLA